MKPVRVDLLRNTPSGVVQVRLVKMGAGHGYDSYHRFVVVPASNFTRLLDRVNQDLNQIGYEGISEEDTGMIVEFCGRPVDQRIDPILESPEQHAAHAAAYSRRRSIAWTPRG